MTHTKPQARAFVGAFLAASSYLETLCSRCYKPGHLARDCRRIRKQRQAKQKKARRERRVKHLDGALSYILEQGEKRRLAREKDAEDESTTVSSNAGTSAGISGKFGGFGATGTSQRSGFGVLTARVNKGGKPASDVFKAAGTPQTSIFGASTAGANKGSIKAADLFKPKDTLPPSMFDVFATGVNEGSKHTANVFKPKGTPHKFFFGV